MSFYTATITLILVMDPLGNIPLFLAILKSVQPKRQAWIILRETFIAFVILTLFLFFGGYILHGLSITEPALNIAGGIILFIIALRMIFPHADAPMQDAVFGEPFIVPLAVPLTAGPATLATVLLFATQRPDRMGAWFGALVIASVLFIIVLLCSRYLMKILGERGLIAVERLMGMILTTVSVQMFLSGISDYFQLGLVK
jgi:multiple antibiotic resistance protein